MSSHKKFLQSVKNVSKEGSTYEGEYRKGVRCGKGKYTSSNEFSSFVYEGEWENDVKHGKGKYTYKEKYNDDDILNDNNVEFYEEQFEGTWINDEKNGKGELRVKGVWCNDNIISTNKIQQSKINEKINNNNSYDSCKESYYNMFPPGEVYEFY
jgi:hypothetical protein